MADTSTDEDGDKGMIPETRASLDFSDDEMCAMAEFVYQEYIMRKADRIDEEMRWDELDRQLRMDPESRVDARSGKPLSQTTWMPNLELHTQAQAHEALTADARRLAFPNDQSWFVAHACMTDDWLEKAKDFPFIPGDKNDTPATGITQEEADVIAECAIENFHGMYSFRQHIDQIFGEAFSYGTGVARVRMMRRGKFTSDYRGNNDTNDGRLIPAVVPRSIRDTYLDDSPSAVMREGFMVAPLQIEYSRLRLADLKLAASMGSTNPGDERGGWQREKLFSIEDDDKNPFVDVLDFEGDIMIPCGSAGVYAPNMVGRVIINKSQPALIRYAKREFPFNSYLTFPYHRIFIGSAYATSPLILGSPLHKSATMALNTLMAVAALSAQPPTSYDPNDQYLLARGGPIIEPGAMWPSQSKIQVHEIGDPQAMGAALAILTKGYEDVTGVNATRLGAQTKSHQTAFAVDSEIGRGLVRTVDVINDWMDNPFVNMLSMEYEMCKTAYTTKPEAVYASRWGMWMNLSRDVLPDRVIFETNGSSGPEEDRQKQQKKMAAIQFALQLEPMVLQLKQAGANVTPLNLDEIRRSVLREGGITDVDPYFQSAPPAQPPQQPAAQPASDAAQPQGGPGAAAPASGNPADSASKIIALATGQPVG